MSVSLLEVLENAGFDIKNNIDDARWFMGQKSDFEELYEEVCEFDDDYNEYCNYEYDMRENGETPLTFELWRERKEQ